MDTGAAAGAAVVQYADFLLLQLDGVRRAYTDACAAEIAYSVWYLNRSNGHLGTYVLFRFG